jgi:hypothetical protein
MFAIQQTGITPTQGVFTHKSLITKKVTNFMPERGQITVMYEGDDGKEEYLRISRATVLDRIKAEGRVSRKAKSTYHDERQNHLNMIEKMIAAYKASGYQGDPLSPAHVADMLKCKHPCSVSLVSTGNKPNKVIQQASLLPENSWFSSRGESKTRLISSIIGDRK